MAPSSRYSGPIAPAGLKASWLRNNLSSIVFPLSPIIVPCNPTQCNIVSCYMPQCSGMGYIFQAWPPTDVYDVSFTCCTGSYIGNNLYNACRYTFP